MNIYKKSFYWFYLQVFTLFLFPLGANSQNISGLITSCNNLTDVVALLNSNTVVGHTIIEIPSSYAGEPSFPITFQEFTTDGVDDWTVTIRPALGATNFITTGVSGTNIPLIIFDGVDRLIIDGRPGGLGNDPEWTFRATSNSAAAFRFRNDAQFNTLTYLKAESRNISSTALNMGTINFHEGTTLGNSFNTISYCEIKDIDSEAIQPDVGIYSQGRQWNIRNQGNQLLHNKIYNFKPNSTSSSGREVAGIWIDVFNSDWIIENNHIYQTSTYIQPIIGTHEVYHVFYGIRVNWASNTGGGFEINNNYIGGTEPFAAGDPWEVDWDPGMSFRVGNIFYGIHLNTSNVIASEVNNNTISNFYWKGRQGSGVNWSHATSTSDPTWTGIYLARGNHNVGTSEGNNIGKATGTDDIVVSTRLRSCVVGIYAQAAFDRELNIENNKVGAITVKLSWAGTNQFTDFIGICVDYASDGSSLISQNLTIRNNLIGSETTEKSINCDARYFSTASDASTGWASQQYTVGIWVIRAGSSVFDVTIDSNTVANLYNNATECRRPAMNFIGVRGIILTTSRGTKTISNNKVFNLGGTVFTTGSTPDRCFAIAGIVTDATVGPTFIFGNEVYGLFHDELNAWVNMAGVFTNNGVASSEIYKNIIHSLSLSTANTAESFIHGIDIWNTRAMYHNNMIRLGIDANGSSVTNGYTINGFYLRQSNGGRTTKFYYNTIYIGGEGVNLGGESSASFYNASTRTDNTNIFRNNIFINERSGNGQHFAVVHQVANGLDTDYNLFRASGTNGVLAKIGGTDYSSLAAWQSGSGGDDHSLSGEVFFVSKDGDASQVDLHIDISVASIIQGQGTILAEVDFDIDDDLRYGNPSSSSVGPGPDIGADEITSVSAVLPVELVYFNGRCDDSRGVELSWKTASEQNASHFSVQRSSTGEDWETIGLFLAAGNANTTNYYSFTDENTPSGLSYYRLVQYDFNGEFEIYGPTSTQCNTKGISIVVYPNPAQDIVYVKLNADDVIRNIQVEIADASGKIVLHETMNNKERGSKQLNISSLSNGVYHLSIRTSDGALIGHEKVVVAR